MFFGSEESVPKKSRVSATIFSVLGGIFGYYIGAYGYELAENWILASHYQSDMNMDLN